ncbi:MULTISPECIES: GH92 family glycosyl hydrolase [Paraburkholderia]|uniref:GH92 family glycosyl hydrolase n=1 Tax=Paraburkholderia TaxID=1822464 RepID=UPI0022586669|nr:MULTISPECIES: GH92 family glycosyl hydrolase [Paraburkholderia]MCX4163073.1 GH92 family glycosyl hydrolase [Paraburkholderia megapolitana]MDN7158569.1 GH92 family glycosyl hydrolase [Paraburkholderia sp. CHISQ3]MDQ6495616.1 GH92 family glycosyl hydrolase [Paraburkholderia megapolitana]
MKRFSEVIFVLLATGILAGCGGDSHPGSGPVDAAAVARQNANSSAGAGGSAGAAAADSAENLAASGSMMRVTQYVNPLIGTLASNSPNPVPAGQAGSVVPAAGLPSGMVQWAPDTNTTPAPSNSAEPGSPAGYYYDINSIQGFSLTHMSGAGCSGNDGEFPVMPTTDVTKLVSTFQHSNEHAQAGAYSVLLDNQVKVELTATLRSGFGRFTYPASQPSILVLNATRTNTRSQVSGSIIKVASNAISGSTIGGGFCGNSTSVPVYFYAQFSKPFNSTSSFSNGIATMNFDAGSTVLMKVGISYVSVDNAKRNLLKENPGWDFDGIKALADRTWNERLNSIQVSGGTPDAMTKFYTALYHASWAPSVFSDVNGQYIGFDNAVHTVAHGQAAQYTSFSGWDIYRSLIPLKAILHPNETSDMVQSLVNDADQCGAIPHWVNDNVEDGVMPGDAGSLMVAGAYAFGARNFDQKGALAHMVKMVNIPGTACQNPGMTTYGGLNDFLGAGHLVPGDGVWAAGSTNLEYTSSNFAVSQFAGALGNTTIQKMALSHSAYWQNVLNTSLTPPLLAARNGDGSWVPESPNSTDNYVEGNAEQYTWMVPFNAAGLFSQLGGNTAVVSRLNTFFTVLNAGMSLPNFYMGNEPTFEVPWMYNWAGSPSGTQNVVQQIMNTAFSTKPDGLPGNDDLGAVSGWYVWGALGLYPQIPAVGGFAIGSPQFPSIVVHLGNGRTLRIAARGAPDSNYVQSLTVNGTAQTSSWLPLAALDRGAKMDFTMGTSASDWGSAASDAPPSFAVPVAQNVLDAFNNHGAGTDGSANTDGNGADFDGGLYSYSSNAMAAAGWNASQPFVFDGATFPTSGMGGLNNAVALGQTITLSGAQPGGNLVVLGSSNNGPSSGQARVTYSDGTSTTFTLAFDDWTLNGGSASVSTGAQTALTMSYRNQGNGQKDNTKTYLFAIKIPLVTGKTVASVTLPRTASTGKLHVFGIAVGS